jgi:hypothetical protein
VLLWCENTVAYKSVARQRPQNKRDNAIPTQEFRKYATVLGLLLGSGPRARMEVLLEAVFSGSESVSYYDRRSVGQSLLDKAPIWGLRPYFYYCQTVSGLLIWGALSDKRKGLSFTIAAGPRQRSHFWVPVPWDL